MTLPTHILLGVIIGKVTGNYSLAISSSVVPDLDHLNSYLKSGVIRNPRLFWKTITDANDPFGDQRGLLHNLISFLLVSIVIFALFPAIGHVVILGWLGHLLLDALDSSEYWPFFPNKKITIRGPIKYASIQEVVFFGILIAIFISL